MSPDRDLDVYADGKQISSFNHGRLVGKDSLGLYPSLFVLSLWNLSDAEYGCLKAAGELSVSCEGSVLAAGEVSDVYRQSVPEGLLTEAAFALGLRLWETPVSLSVEAGVSVSETVRRILDASGTGVSLLSFPGPDPVHVRGQAFFGRMADCVEEALSAAKARPYLTPAGLCIVPVTGLPVSMNLSEADLTDAPVPVGKNQALLRTTVTGWPLGKIITASRRGETVTGLVTERSVYADTMNGRWEAEIMMEIKDS